MLRAIACILLGVHQHKCNDERQDENDDAQNGDEDSHKALAREKQRAADAEQQHANGKHHYRNWIQVHISPAVDIVNGDARTGVCARIVAQAVGSGRRKNKIAQKFIDADC
jgi:hypothetical protein